MTDTYWIHAIRSAMHEAWSRHSCADQSGCGFCIFEEEMHESAKNASKAPIEKRDLAERGTIIREGDAQQGGGA